MGDINVGSGGIPSLPLPGGQDAGYTEASQTNVTKNQTLPQIQDKITTSVQKNQVVFDKVNQAIHSDEPYMPVPFSGSSQASGGKGDPGGRGNPWLVPNPVVYIQQQMLELYETLRQSNLVMAQYEITTMELNSAYAETAAALIMQAGQAEANMAKLEAIAAGIAAGASAIALGASAIGFGHGMTTGKNQMKASKSQMEESQARLGQEGDGAIPDKNTKVAQFERAQADFSAKQTKLDDLKTERAALESPAAGTKKPTNAELKAQQDKAAQLDKQIDAKKDEVAAARKDMVMKQEELNIAQKEFGNYQSDFLQKQNTQFNMFNNITQMAGMLNTLLSQGAVAITKGMSVEEIMAKAQAQATQQIVDALRENIKQSGQAASQTQQQSKDAMNSLIQNLDKIVDENMRAMTMTRNG
ncbi:MAG TPA: flagellar export protein FliJ [Parachlamydiaceae bacterium]|nr:flagellar export protein FliJ [Parachlamydiaceae bacterium]